MATGPDIQVDMFEVQLGAALLVQFRQPKGKVVNILADAGVKAAGYSLDHVLKKLPRAMATFASPNGATKKIDLIIGTHYDADHLDGLVPIVEDTSYSIGEAWLPPVANDVEMHALEDSLSDNDLLPIQFAREEGDVVFNRYVDIKAQNCEYFKRFESLLIESDAPSNEASIFSRPPFREFRDRELHDQVRNYFKNHMDDASQKTGGSTGDHAMESVIEEPLSLDEFVPKYLSALSWFRYSLYEEGILHELMLSKKQPEHFPAIAQTLAYMRKSAARDAINASSLKRLVAALKARKIPIRCHTILDGVPRLFCWDENSGRFDDWRVSGRSRPTLTLLGPSRGLVDKHWKRLPIGAYMVASLFTPIPVKSITPSNQLSYVMKLSYLNQGILVTGDAGFVDFKEKGKGSYFQKLLSALGHLNVVQVAHHGGNNAHFYRAMIESGYPVGSKPTFLLLSHATHDLYRPSAEFVQFVAQAFRKRHLPSVLFTSQPSKEKVSQLKTLVAKSVGVTSQVGDICLVYENKRWNVKKHAIKV